MKASRDVPRRFDLHWGSGEIAEEATFVSEHHQPSFQLMRFTAGAVEGTSSVRFCTYTPDGRFQRSPLILAEAEIETMREALRRTPELRSLLRRLVDDEPGE